MRRHGFRLTVSHETWMYSIAGALFLTGAIWLVFHYFVRVEGAFGPAPHMLERWWLRLHGAAAFAMLFLLGTIAVTHARQAWAARRNRLTGAIMASLNVLLVLTGYLLYYAGGEISRETISVLHWVLGLGFPLVIIAHVLKGRALRRSVASATRRPAPASTGLRIPS